MESTGTYAFRYVTRDGKPLAIMERSPWTGEWCYGAVIPGMVGKYGEAVFRPPFQQTYRKSLPAALKVVNRECP